MIQFRSLPLPRGLIVTVVALVAFAPFPASASDPCAPIASAFEKLAAAPAYRQVIRVFGQKPVTSLTVGQKFYVQQDGQWQALELKPGERLTLMKAAVGAGMNGCEEKTPDALNGQPVKVYAYKPPETAEAQGAVPQTIWVGATDGLPRRIFSPTVDTEVTYDDVQAPPAAPQAQ